ncbi:unnamed protein product, partial [Pleuronectes platessa]
DYKTDAGGKKKMRHLSVKLEEGDERNGEAERTGVQRVVKIVGNHREEDLAKEKEQEGKKLEGEEKGGEDPSLSPPPFSLSSSSSSAHLPPHPLLG